MRKLWNFDVLTSKVLVPGKAMSGGPALNSSPVIPLYIEFQLKLFQSD